jgi:23S rRNA (pseudouridine1915-N3)-methyltransferase
MLKINIVAIGKLKEQYLRDASSEYLKRLSAFCKTTVTELDPDRLPDNPNPSQIDACLNSEAAKIIAVIPNGAYVIPMCIEGKQIDSVELSVKLQDIALSGDSTICFIIGGSYGLSDKVKQMANFKLSMSKMTFPHQLARIMLLEQIYRAFKISQGGTYHK